MKTYKLSEKSLSIEAWMVKRIESDIKLIYDASFWNLILEHFMWVVQIIFTINMIKCDTKYNENGVMRNIYALKHLSSDIIIIADMQWRVVKLT